jgi:hypothetical protein
MKTNLIDGAAVPLGKGEVDSSILSGSTRFANSFTILGRFAR